MVQPHTLRQMADRISSEGDKLELRVADWVKRNPRAARIVKDIRALWRIVAAWRRGDYHPRRRSLIIAILALSYFLNPIDLIPDFIPVIGWLDDVGVYLIAMALLAKEIKRFVEWENRSNS